MMNEVKKKEARLSLTPNLNPPTQGLEGRGKQVQM